jgi:hypothetical protein
VLDKVLMGFLKINLLEWYPGIIALSVRTVRKTGTVPSFIVSMVLYAFLFLVYTLAVIDRNKVDDMLLFIRLEDKPESTALQHYHMSILYII